MRLKSEVRLSKFYGPRPGRRKVSFMAPGHAVEKGVLWPQGPWWMQAKLNQALHDNTHTYNCALSTCTHILGKVHFMCIHDKIKDGKCLALKQEPVILIRLIMTLLESSSTLAYLAKEKKKLTNIISFLHMNYILVCMYFI